MPGQGAVDDHRLDAFSRLRRRFVSGLVDHGGRIEYDDIGMLPDGNRSPVGQTKIFRREAAHLPDSGLQWKQADIAAVVAEHPWECPPKSRMRFCAAGQ